MKAHFKRSHQQSLKPQEPLATTSATKRMRIDEGDAVDDVEGPIHDSHQVQLSICEMLDSPASHPAPSFDSDGNFPKRTGVYYNYELKNLSNGQSVSYFLKVMRKLTN